MKSEISRLMRFCITGGVVAVFYVVGYTYLVRNGFTPFDANLVAFCTAVAVQYVGQTCWTFRQPLWNGMQTVRFLIIIGIGVIYSSIMCSIVGPRLDWLPLVSAGVVAVTLPFINFFAFRLWVYGGGKTSGE